MKEKRKSKVWLILFLVFTVVFCVSAYQVVTQLIAERRESRMFADLTAQVEANRQTVQNSSQQTEPVPGDSENAKGSMLPVYAVLYEQNPDLFGWIEVKGTKINYPVMYTPEDPEHYLRRAFDGSSAQSGVPFLDGSYFEGCGNYLVYGHNMKNGTMFSDVLSYADENYWREHPIIRFDTLYEEGTYEVLSAFYSRVYSVDEEGVFRYYRYINLSDPAVYEEYVEQVKAAALYDTGIDAVYGDQLLTLSTCEYRTENGRFVVVARKIKTDEED